MLVLVVVVVLLLVLLLLLMLLLIVLLMLLMLLLLLLLTLSMLLWVLSMLGLLLVLTLLTLGMVKLMLIMVMLARMMMGQISLNLNTEYLRRRSLLSLLFAVWLLLLLCSRDENAYYCRCRCRRHRCCVADVDVDVDVDADGDILANNSNGTFDEYEDANLVRAVDLSHGRGVIDSKFDKFVKYNSKQLMDLDLIGKDKDGSPNNFVNVTKLQRLHNGAIWQQYEKHNQLLEAVYELAKEAVGEEKANAILDKHEVKRLQ